MDKIHNDNQEIKMAENKIKDLSQKMASAKEKTSKLLNQATAFKCARCEVCREDIKLPSLFFLCGHAYHKYCFDGHYGNDPQCPVCLDENKRILAKVNSKTKVISDEEFNQQLNRTSDGFSTMIDMLSRGEILIPPRKKTDNSDQSVFGSPSIPVPPSKKLLASRAKIAASLKSQSMGNSYTNSPKQSSSRATPPNIVHAKVELHDRPATDKMESLVSKNDYFVKNDSSNRSSINPFEEEDNVTNPFQEDTTNPFDNSDETESTNPFGDDDDNSKNPFAAEADRAESKNPFGDEGNPFEDDTEEFDETNPFS